MMKNLLTLLTLAGAINMLAQPVLTTSPTNTCYSNPGNSIGTVSVSNNTSATSFSWTVAGPNCAGSVLAAGGLTAQVQYNCCGTQTITCVGYVNGVPNWSTQAYPVLYCPPSLSISAAAGTVMCSGASNTLMAFGASGYSWAPGGSNGYQQYISPFSNTCYTVTGMDSWGCKSATITCIIVNAGPSMSVAGGGTVCLGSSATLTVTGANTYTWVNPNSSSHTVNVLPTSPSWYVVFGTGPNGCTDSTATYVNPLNTCAIVWPGDANSDGVVNASDVLELGLQASSTGAARSPGGNSFTGQFATAWNGNGSNNQNKCHADCNGDGTVNAGDTLAIWTNFSMTHSFRQNAQATAGDINIIAPPYLLENNWATADIVVGSSTNVINNLYGIAFDLSFDAAKIDNNQVFVRYTPSFLNANSQNIPFRRIVNGSGVANCATVRVDHSHVSGQGKIGELVFKVPLGKGKINFAVSNVIKTDASGNKTVLTGSTAESSIISPAGVGEINGSGIIPGFYPNPAGNNITFTGAPHRVTEYGVYDLSGRLLLHGSFMESAIVAIGQLGRGVYLVTLNANGEKITKRLIVQP